MTTSPTNTGTAREIEAPMTDRMEKVRRLLMDAKALPIGARSSYDALIDEALELLPEGEGGNSRAVPLSSAQVVEAIATAWHDGFISALGCEPWDDASDWAILTGQSYALGEDMPSMPWPVLGPRALKPPEGGRLATSEPHPSNEQMIGELCEALLADLDLFRQAIEAGDPKGELLERIRLIRAPIRAALSRAQTRGEA